jgi:hypothetical protein
MMIPETKRRLEAAHQDLSDLVVCHSEHSQLGDKVGSGSRLPGTFLETILVTLYVLKSHRKIPQHQLSLYGCLFAALPPCRAQKRALLTRQNTPPPWMHCRGTAAPRDYVPNLLNSCDIIYSFPPFPFEAYFWPDKHRSQLYSGDSSLCYIGLSRKRIL